MAETSGFRGVCWHKRRNKWVAFATVSGRQLHLGCFDTAEEAHEADPPKRDVGPPDREADHAAYLEAKARVNRSPRQRRRVGAANSIPPPETNAGCRDERHPIQTTRTIRKTETSKDAKGKGEAKKETAHE